MVMDRDRNRDKTRDMIVGSGNGRDICRDMGWDRDVGIDWDRERTERISA